MTSRLRTIVVVLGFCIALFIADWTEAETASRNESDRIPTGFTVHAESHDLSRFQRIVQPDAVFLHDAEGKRMFRCLSDRRFTPDNVEIAPSRGLVLKATVTGDGASGTEVAPEHTHGGGVQSGKHYSGEFSFWSFAPDAPSHRVRVNVYSTLPRPLGSMLAIWSFADAWYPGGGSVISLEMDLIEAGGREDEWIDGSRNGLFRYHPNLHCWFGGGSPWGHNRVFHTEPKPFGFGPEDAEHKFSWEWHNSPAREAKVLRYLIDDQVVYERSVAHLSTRYPQLDRGSMKGVQSTMNAREIAEFMWDKPQNLQLWYGVDREFFLSGVPKYGEDWPSEMVVRRIEVFR